MLKNVVHFFTKKGVLMVDINIMSIVVFLVVVAVCMFLYNALISPAIGRPMPMMPVMDLIFLLIFIGIIIFALQASGLWDRVLVVRT